MAKFRISEIPSASSLSQNSGEGSVRARSQGACVTGSESAEKETRLWRQRPPLASRVAESDGESATRLPFDSAALSFDCGTVVPPLRTSFSGRQPRIGPVALRPHLSVGLPLSLAI